jgi:hypothetical protein
MVVAAIDRRLGVPTDEGQQDGWRRSGPRAAAGPFSAG